MHELKLMDVWKRYKDKDAVREVDYTFTNGVYGLLGENGAGKTTLMRLICGVMQPTKGKICCDNLEISGMGAEYRKLLGYLPQDFGFYPDFTAERFLRYMAALKALPKDDAEKRIEELLIMVELKNVRRKKLKTFSGGMLRRIGIAQTLLNNPEILVLDEPTAGLDPKGESAFSQYHQFLRQRQNCFAVYSYCVGYRVYCRPHFNHEKRRTHSGRNRGGANRESERPRLEMHCFGKRSRVPWAAFCCKQYEKQW